MPPNNVTVSQLVRDTGISDKHSGLKFLTPRQRHRGEAKKLMNNRKTVYELAKERHLERWGTRAISNWDLCSEVRFG
ncbi:MAG: hypothetical protein PUP46_03405, partial [Endozoicomonas sp. (ex Botrylloides leachii)]|nr:hypothetical protein [Endozoicomonas sp. (ex Botrylloides leachii)]